MKKRLTAFLTAICCMAMNAPVVCAFAEEELPVTEFAVINKTDTKAVIIKIEKSPDLGYWETYYIDDLAEFEAGDVLEYTGEYSHTEGAGTTDFIRQNGGIFKKVVFSDDFDGWLQKHEHRSFKVTDISENYQLTDKEETFTYFSDWMKSEPHSFGFDWGSIQKDDEIIFSSYKGTPIVPFAFTRMEKPEYPITHFVILNQNGNDTVVMNLDNLQKTHLILIHENWSVESQQELFNDFEVGDILEYDGDYKGAYCTSAVPLMVEDGTFQKVGSIFDNPEQASFQLEDDGFYLNLSNDTGKFTYPIDWILRNSMRELPFDFDWVSVRKGDSIGFYTYEGVPVIPYAITEKSTLPPEPPKGDIDGSGTVDIVDVLAVNQALLGLRKFSETALEVADVNHSGFLDDGDAMMILKSLVGLTVLL